MGAAWWTLRPVLAPMTGGRGRPAGPVPDHGTRNRYRHRTEPCSCERCRAANALAHRNYLTHGTTRPERSTTDG